MYLIALTEVCVEIKRLHKLTCLSCCYPFYTVKQKYIWILFHNSPNQGTFPPHT